MEMSKTNSSSTGEMHIYANLTPVETKASMAGHILTKENLAEALGPETLKDGILDLSTIQFAFDVDGCLLNSEAPIKDSKGNWIDSSAGLHDASWAEAAEWALKERNAIKGAPESPYSSRDIMAAGTGHAEPLAVKYMLNALKDGLPEGINLNFSEKDFTDIRFHCLWNMLDEAGELCLEEVREIVDFCVENEIPMVVNSSSSLQTLQALFFKAFELHDTPYDTFRKITSATDFKDTEAFKPEPVTWLYALDLVETKNPLEDEGYASVKSNRKTIILENSPANAVAAASKINHIAVPILITSEEEKINMAQYVAEELKQGEEQKHLLVTSSWTGLLQSIKELSFSEKERSLPVLEFAG